MGVGGLPDEPELRQTVLNEAVTHGVQKKHHLMPS